ncbi:MAG TPA: GvpL/GvpF family gas vesicle protein [Verrucomicrobiae bacterium]|jgi:hypothetical protein|nr:GvpL/GvpF family gas vesicle protein [Verrucomicrobiae bacterium]
MNKVLAYCGFLHQPALSLPDAGVNGAAVECLQNSGLCLLWSDVQWPLDPPAMQRNAVEFHRVVTHMFSQDAVVPFRLLSLFDDRASLGSFVAEHGGNFVADLERLRAFVQMECVIYFGAPVYAQDSISGTRYLQDKAELLRIVEDYVANVKAATAGAGMEVRLREVKHGTRIFVLAERGREEEFRAAVNNVPVPDRLARRTSGPWPASEFLSAQVRTPKITGAQ